MLRFEDKEDISRNVIAQLHTVSEVETQRCINCGKLTGISVSNAKGTSLKFHSLLISVFVNKVSMSVSFTHHHISTKFLYIFVLSYKIS